MKVLLALDGSESSERAAAVTARWAREIGAEVTLYSAFNPDDVPTTSSQRLPAGVFATTDGAPRLQEDRTQALARTQLEHEGYLKEIARNYFDQLSCATVTESATDAAPAIIAAAAKSGVDVIAIGSHGHSGFDRSLLGSVAASVVRRAPVPVLVTGPGAITDWVLPY